MNRYSTTTTAVSATNVEGVSQSMQSDSLVGASAGVGGGAQSANGSLHSVGGFVVNGHGNGNGNGSASASGKMQMSVSGEEMQKWWDRAEQLLTAMNAHEHAVRMSSFGGQFSAMYGKPVWRKLRAAGFGPRIEIDGDSMKLLTGMIPLQNQQLGSPHLNPQVQESYKTKDTLMGSESQHSWKDSVYHPESSEYVKTSGAFAPSAHCNGVPVFLIATQEHLSTLCHMIDVKKAQNGGRLSIAIDTEGELAPGGHISLLQIFVPGQSVSITESTSVELPLPASAVGSPANAEPLSSGPLAPASEQRQGTVTPPIAGEVFIVDIVALWSVRDDFVINERRRLFSSILGNPMIEKVIHDSRRDVATIKEHMGVEVSNIVDTQFLYAVLAELVRINGSASKSRNLVTQRPGSLSGTGHNAHKDPMMAIIPDPNVRVGLNHLLDIFGLGLNQLKEKFHAVFSEAGTLDIALWSRRPITPDMLEYAASDVVSLLEARKMVQAKVQEEFAIFSDQMVLKGSALHAEQFQFQDSFEDKLDAGMTFVIDFDPLTSFARYTPQVAPPALLKSTLDTWRTNIEARNLSMWEKFVSLVPQNWADAIKHMMVTQGEQMLSVSSLSVDLGHHPRLNFMSGVSYELTSLPKVDRSIMMLLKSISPPCRLLAEHPSWMRIGVDGALHQVSCFRNMASDIVGLTFQCRLQRPSALPLVRDLFLKSPPQHTSHLPFKSSALLCGRPGTGKSLVLRHIASELSHRGENTLIVDTWGDIGGLGDEPSPDIGLARRCLVPRRQEQAALLTEYVRIHRPSTVIVGEIETLEDLQALCSISYENLRLFCGMTHESFRNALTQNPNFRAILIPTDEQGIQSDLQLPSKSLFDCVVEMAGADSVRIYRDPPAAVRGILRKSHYAFEDRWIDAKSGLPFVHRREMNRGSQKGSAGTADQSPFEQWFRSLLLNTFTSMDDRFFKQSL
eukprot:ANDGO_07674.mRNA.1 Uncharacterized protein ycf45